MAVLPVDWPALARRFGGGVPAVLSEVLGGASEVAANGAFDLLHVLETASPTRRLTVLVEHLREQIARVLGLDASLGIEEGQGLFDLGMDSLMAVELKNRLELSFGPLPATLAFDYPTLKDLADFLVGHLFPDTPPPSRPEPEADTRAAGLLDKIQGLSDEQLGALIDAELDALIGREGIDREGGPR